MKVLYVKDPTTRLSRVEDARGRRGWMIRIGTPSARLSPTGRYRYTCPYCGRYVKARKTRLRCRDCLGDVLSAAEPLTWARREVTRRQSHTPTTRSSTPARISADVEIAQVNGMSW